jgi:hypothetical protein
MSEHQTAEVVPFHEIAVALSGGGFRAACFSLGCLSYLQRVHYQRRTLLSRVRFISSASGGSITNLVYTSRAEKGQSFLEIFEALHEKLKGEQVIEKAFQILSEKSYWKERPDKGRNLINAFAMAYDRVLFDGEDFTALRNNLPDQVEEVCVNATEFTNGITFRFQAGGSGLIGNKYLHFKDPAVADKLKLGDILAASSCFPMGFEPIIFPDDFAHAALSRDDLIRGFRERTNAEYLQESEAEASLNEEQSEKKRFEPIGLMDGGITDNQGIYSFLLAEERKRKANGRGYDLFIACDVASSYMDAYEIPVEKKSRLGRWSVASLVALFRLSPLLLVAGIAALIAWRSPGWLYVLTTLAGVSSIAYFVSAALWRNGKKAMIHGNRTWGITLFKYLDTVLSIRVSALTQMLNARLKSVGIMTGDVYLKQIRRLTFMSLYENESSGAKWRLHGLANFIYELAPINKANRKTGWRNLLDRNGARTTPEPSAAMERVAEKAQQMDTTLWFDAYQVRDEVQEALIATGQFTTCYNLIRYTNRLLEKDPANADLKQLLHTLMDDWSQFQIDPSRLDTPVKWAAAAPFV